MGLRSKNSGHDTRQQAQKKIPAEAKLGGHTPGLRPRPNTPRHPSGTKRILLSRGKENWSMCARLSSRPVAPTKDTWAPIGSGRPPQFCLCYIQVRLLRGRIVEKLAWLGPVPHFCFSDSPWKLAFFGNWPLFLAQLPLPTHGYCRRTSIARVLRTPHG